MIAKLLEKKKVPNLAIALFFGIMTVLLWLCTPKDTPYNGPLLMAQRMLQGYFYLPDRLGWMEGFMRNGEFYIGYPPLVSVLLLPWALIGLKSQPIYNSFLILLTLVGLFYVGRKFKLPTTDIFLTLILYVFGTSNINSVASGDVWQMMHTQGSFFALLFAIAYFYWKKPFWAGVLLAIAFNCRHSLVCLSVVVLVAEWLNSKSWKVRFKNLVTLGIGAVLVQVICLFLQYKITGDFRKSPYHLTWEQWGKQEVVFGLRYLTTNLLFYFTALPTLSSSFPFFRFHYTGQSFLLLSPFLVGVFFLSKKDKVQLPLAIGCLATFAFYLFYWWNGCAQFGSRYIQDFFSLLVPVAVFGMTKWQKKFRNVVYGLIALSLFFNSFGAYSFYKYPAQ